MFASALLYNGLGRYEDALSAASRGSKYPEDLAFCNWSLVELVEAASRTGQIQLAAASLERLVERSARAAPTGHSGSRNVRGH